MTIADICRAWDRPSYVHGDVPSTHTLTRKFREGDRTPETVGRVLMKYQPYLQRYANRHFPKHLDEAEEAYVDFVLAVVKRPYLFNKDFAKPLRSFVFRCYKHKLLDVLKRNHRRAARDASTRFRSAAIPSATVRSSCCVPTEMTRPRHATAKANASRIAWPEHMARSSSGLGRLRRGGPGKGERS